MPVLQELKELAEEWDASLSESRYKVGAYCFQINEWDWDIVHEDADYYGYDVEFDTPSSKSATYVTAKLDEVMYQIDEVEDDLFHISDVRYERSIYVIDYNDYVSVEVLNAESIAEEWTIREVRALLKAAKQILKEQHEVEERVKAELEEIRAWVEGYAVGKLKGNFSNGEAVFERLDGNPAILTGRYDELAE